MTGSFKREEEEKAQIKILGTPLLLNFKILGGGTPPDPGSCRRMFAVKTIEDTGVAVLYQSFN